MKRFRSLALALGLLAAVGIADAQQVINAPISFTTTTPAVTNVSSVALAANASRHFLFIQNNDTAGIVYVNFGATATTAHAQIGPGQNWTFYSPMLNSVTVIGSIASNANVVIIEGN